MEPGFENTLTIIPALIFDANPFFSMLQVLSGHLIIPVIMHIYSANNLRTGLNFDPMNLNVAGTGPK